jgi:hypothetical protein
MGVGAALVLILLKWARGFDVNDEIMLMNLVWAGAFFAKLALEKRLKVAGHG